MLKVKLIDEQATLNNFKYVDTKEYIPGQRLVLNVQILDAETGQRLIPDSGAQINAIFQQSDGTELTIPGSALFDPDDRSMYQFVLTGAQTLLVIGGNVRFDLDFNGSGTLPALANSSDLRMGMGYSLIAKITFDGDC
jgi:hypothetical protein